MIKIYGSEKCPDCVECKANFDYNKLEYEYIDITSSMKNLKEFLRLRDNLEVFKEARELSFVGIPCLVLEGETITLDWEKVLKDKNLEVIHFSIGQSCGIDGKGC